jgi:hypothetical protein
LKDRIHKTVLLLAFIGIVLLFPAQNSTAEEYLWPIQGYRTLTGTFGEFRYSHFHAGIDVSTKGAIGLPLRAIDDGYVYRTRTSPLGYGRAVYLTLEDGNVAVYAHLSKFSQAVETWVRDKQLESGNFSMDAYPAPALFPVKKGDVIGYSGDSGNVPAHLHFELRTKDNRPINPINHVGSLPPGQAPPRVVALAVNPIGIDSTVDETWETKVYKARWNKRQQAYTIQEDIYVWGRCGIEVCAYDLSRGYQMGLRKVELFANDRLVSTVAHDSFSFREYRHNYRMVDRELFLEGQGKFRRLYQSGKNSLSFYSVTDGKDGTLSTLDPTAPEGLKLGKNRIRITVESNGKKKRSLHCNLIGRPSFFHKKGAGPLQGADDSTLPLESLKAKCSVRFIEDFVVIEMVTDPAPPGIPQCSIYQNNKKREEIALFPRSSREFVGRYRLAPHVDGMSRARIRFSSPAGERKEIFYSFMVQTVSPERGGTVVSDDNVVRVTFRPEDVDTCMFPQIEKGPVTPRPASLEPLSLSYGFEPLNATFNSPGKITFRYDKPFSKPHQCAVFYKDKGKYWRCCSSRNDPEKRTISAQIPFFATFALMRDAHSPVINRVFPQSGTSVRSGNTRFSARISDKGTGINYRKTYMNIDGRKVPAEYVPKKGVLIFNAPKPLKAGTHSMEIGTSDLVGNTSGIAVTFRVEAMKRLSGTGGA